MHSGQGILGKKTSTTQQQLYGRLIGGNNFILDNGHDIILRSFYCEYRVGQ